MSEQAVLWLFGVLITALFGLVATLAKVVWSKLAELDSGALAAFVARDGEREKQWMFWREAADKRFDTHAAEIKNHENRITRLERNGNH